MNKYLSILVTTSILGFGAEEPSTVVDKLVTDMTNLSHMAEAIKMNETFQPYIVSVFQGHELESIGVTSLQEALELVPGVDIATNNMDNKRAIFRGSNPFAYGQSKLFIDGVEVNNLFFDSYGSFLSMPIEMIKRIEVTRGPGSVSDGVNAYVGSIRVITYAEYLKNDNDIGKVVLKRGTYLYRMGGVTYRYRKGDLLLFTDAYYQKDNKSLLTGKDSLATGIYGPANTTLSKSGNAPLWLDNYAIGLQLRYKNFKLTGRTLCDKRGSAYGINGALPGKNDYTKFPTSYLQLIYDKEIDVSWHSIIKAGWIDSAFESSSKLLPNGFDAGGGIVYLNGFFAEHQAKQRTLYQTSSFEYRGYKNHVFNIGYYLEKAKTYKILTKTTNRLTGIGVVDYSQTFPSFDPNAKRDTYRLFLQDRFRYSDKWSIQYGINIEKVSHMKTQYNPRIAAVCQSDPVNIYKFIYSRSSRTPSWQELYTINNHAIVGNRDLKPETVNAFEAAYIHKFSVDAFVQLNLFYLHNSDQINNINADNQYRNTGSSNIYGMEAELKAPVGLHGTLYANYSYVYGKEDHSYPIANAARHMAKGYYLHQLTDKISIGMIGQYVGSKERVWYDYREKLDPYATLDLTIGYHDRRSGLRLQLSAKNIFDTTVKYPSPPYNYDDDFTQEGRTVMFTLSKAF